MGADEKLYSLLAGDREIPWGLAAGQFLSVKVASGGLYPDDAREVCKVVLAAAKEELEERGRKAVEQGVLSGIRSIPAGDIAAVGRATRTRGSRIGDVLGMAGGTAAGLLATRGGVPTSKAVGAVLGALGGKTVGKAVGTEIDSARARARLASLSKTKAAEIEKRAEGKKEMSPGAKSALIGAGLGAVAGSGYGGLVLPFLAQRSVGKMVQDAHRLMSPEGTKELLESGVKPQAVMAARQNADRFLLQHYALEHESGNIPGAGVKPHAEALLKHQNYGFGPAGRTLSTMALGAALGALSGAALHRYKQERNKGLNKKASVTCVLRAMAKVAEQPSGDSTITSPVTPLPSETQMTHAQQAPLHPEIEQQLDRLQQTNEADFYRQQAEEAQAAAEQGRQRVEELIQQLNMLNQQAQMQTMQDQQVRQMAEQQAQMASQDATMARDESLQAQQQNMQLRTAVTQFRQALMNLVAQDPTTVMGPPPVQTGPMPQPGMPQEQGMPAAPPEAGPQPGAPPAQPAAPVQAAPPAPMPPAPEMKPPEPIQPPAPGAAPAQPAIG